MNSTRKISLFLLFGLIAISVLTNGYLAVKYIYSPDTKTSYEQTNKSGFDHLEVVERKHKCLSYDVDLDKLIGEASHIFIAIPEKAGGKTLSKFAEECSHTTNFHQFTLKKKKDLLMSSLELPKVIASWYLGDSAWVNIMKNSSKKNLIILIHRDETDRLTSAIKQVMTTHACGNNVRTKHYNAEKLNMVKTGTQCYVDEEPMLDEIETRKDEMKKGPLSSCGLHTAIELHAPNLVLFDYKGIDKLQALIAKHHCPELEDNTLRLNAGSEKEMSVFVRLNQGRNATVALDTWLEAKKDMIEWSLDLRKDFECQAKTKKMEDELFSCPDQAIQVSA